MKLFGQEIIVTETKTKPAKPAIPKSSTPPLVLQPNSLTPKTNWEVISVTAKMATITILFRFKSGSNTFKVTATRRKVKNTSPQEYVIKFNCHDPDKIVPKEQKSKALARVTDDISALEGYRTVKKSTGSMGIKGFPRALKQRLNCEVFTNIIMRLLNEQMNAKGWIS